MNIPTGHQAVMPYLTLENANGFLTFTQQVFQATVSFRELHDDNQTIRHAEIQISGSTIMTSEAREQWKAQPGNLFVYVEDADSSYQTALDNGATSVMPLSDQSYGRTCGVKDPCGNIWWITSVK
ncbi:VOC family protein [Chitinophaga flava]|uniref:VOC family protein n=1 Tax=Chitinophaga flava TaxID=2259036 RepID=A0A365XT65_9BACT|nr:VOC family protein [Chitinophaga flava]RBL89330.1 VOC family protein [Chitinophaga flava]